MAERVLRAFWPPGQKRRPGSLVSAEAGKTAPKERKKRRKRSVKGRVKEPVIYAALRPFGLRPKAPSPHGVYLQLLARLRGTGLKRRSYFTLFYA